MATNLVLFTRDLRVLDNPTLHAAVTSADDVIPLFVLDPVALAAASPNRRWALAGALRDLRASLRGRGSDLVIRHGNPVAVIWELAIAHQVTAVHMAADVSKFASARRRRLADMLQEVGVALEEHDSHVIVPPGEVAPVGGTHYQVFGAYFRSWDSAPRRAVLAAPERVRLVAGIDAGELPSPGDLANGATSPLLLRVGEPSALALARHWFAQDVGEYEALRDDLAADRTSRMSAPLHFGTISAAWVEEQLDLADPGHRAFRRQLCWRDFSHQHLAAFPVLPEQDYRSRGDVWRSAGDEVEAWRRGQTGVPVVDAGMRQLLAEGWMHNRARMIVASYLTKTLYVDWRVGAAHFNDWLVDADVATNAASWQWTAGTGTDSRPNRVYSPLLQAARYDPTGDYIRRWVPELSAIEDPRDVREPWRLAGTLNAPDYPNRIVDHAEGRARFLEARGVL